MLSKLALFAVLGTVYCAGFSKSLTSASPTDTSHKPIVLITEDFDPKSNLEGIFGGNTGALAIDRKIFRSPSGSLRFAGTSGEGRVVLPTSASIRPGQFVEAECWVKLANATGKTYFQLEWLKDGNVVSADIGGSPYGPVSYLNNPVSGTRDWIRLKVRAFVPTQANSVRLVLSSDENSGTAWFDDVKAWVVPPQEVLGEVDKNPLFIDPSSLKPDDYVTVRNRHLYYKGKRLRIWSAQGNLLGLTHADIDREIAIFKKRGFNGYRSLWWDPEVSDNYTPGDNSIQDKRDYLIAALGRNGLFVWCDLLNSCQIRPEHVNVIDDPVTAEEWTAAVKELVGTQGYRIIQGLLPLAWDERCQKIYHNYIKRVLNHKNPYNGLTYAEDPTFFCWELTNEEWWIMRVLWGEHLKLPAFFQKNLYKKWNSWLARKYKTEKALRDAWGELLEGESLETSTVMLIPILGDANATEMAKVLGLKVEFAKTSYRPEDFSKQRAIDVIRFLAELVINYKNEAAKVFRSQGRKGLGCQIVPLVYVLGYSGAVIPPYIQSFGNATAVGVYEDMCTHDPNHPTFPFASALRNPPMINGWLTTRRVAGKPAFVYENMVFNPQKYRVEWIYRLLAWAAIQDYDVISFHYYGHPLPQWDTPDIHTGVRLHYVQKWSVWEGTMMRQDEVLMAAVKVAGEIFKLGYLKPAPSPTRVTLGSETLWSFEGVFGSPYEEPAEHTVFHRGFEWAFDPSNPKDFVNGELVQPNQATSKPVVSPTDQINYRWTEGIMVIDDPRAKVLVGFAPESFRFADGLRFSNISVASPQNMPFVIKSERYVGIGLVSCDGKPLSKSSKILISAANTSFNSGLEIDPKILVEDKRYAEGLAQSIISEGDTPILVGRVGVRIQAEWLKGRQYEMIDYNGKLIAKGTLKTGELVIPSDKPVHLTVISRKRPGYK
ncbi:MAG: hypothetical protein N3B12_00580 [Armatimonadetes bacterium]|nr:hypothetical protein [Armatimonadota bacterium]